jgi:HAD superfamily hydrolase (TIGR01509 family)
MHRNKVLVFDLGGVLLENTGREALTAMLPSEMEPGDVRLRWLASSVVQRFEQGHISADEFAHTLVKEWKLKLDPVTFIEAFATWPKGFFPGAKELLGTLRTQHRVICLSNSNEVHWARFPELPTLFDLAFSSHQIGHVKPDREAFEFVVARANADAHDIYFFDDLLPNVEAARALGIKAFQVEGLPDLKAALHSEMLYAESDA